MEFKDVFNHHLSNYISSGASVSNRLNFLTLLFIDFRKNGFDIEESRRAVCSNLKLSFTNELIDQVYELSFLRDIDKAIALTAEDYQELPNSEEEEIVANPSPELDPDHAQPDDVPNVDREVYKSRKAVIDYEFLKSLGTDPEYLKYLGYKE